MHLRTKKEKEGDRRSTYFLLHSTSESKFLVALNFKLSYKVFQKRTTKIGNRKKSTKKQAKQVVLKKKTTYHYQTFDSGKLFEYFQLSLMCADTAPPSGLEQLQHYYLCYNMVVHKSTQLIPIIIIIIFFSILRQLIRDTFFKLSFYS